MVLRRGRRREEQSSRAVNDTHIHDVPEPDARHQEPALTTKVRSYMQSSQAKVRWDALEGDKGFYTGPVLDRRAAQEARAMVDEINVPRTDIQWRQKLGVKDYRYLRLHTWEAPGTGRFCTFGTIQNRPEGIFRCRGCSNFLFNSQDVIRGRHRYIIFDDSFPGCLIESSHPKAKEDEVDCAICLSFIGQLEDRGFECNSAALVFEGVPKKVISMVRKMCHNRWKDLE